MRKFFTNWKIVLILTLLLLLFGGLFGAYIGAKTQEVMLVTYGFVAFSVLPITLCTFGLKELNDVWRSVAEELEKVQRRKLARIIENRYYAVIWIAFFDVLVQLVFAFCINIPGANIWWILGVLFGGILSVLLYGLFVCFSVREAVDFVNQVEERTISEKKNRELISKLSSSR